jgi:hypothetical protein
MKLGTGTGPVLELHLPPIDGARAMLYLLHREPHIWAVRLKLGVRKAETDVNATGSVHLVVKL